MSIQSLIAQEGWKIIQKNGSALVETEYAEKLGLIAIKHPALIHLELYRKHTDPELKYQHMKKAHDMLWPDTEWHYWTEDRFRAHCQGYNYITLAAGASASKSYDIAKLALLFWYANPTGRNVTIASVTLSSLMTRVWGYVTKHLKEMAVDLPYKYYRAAPPRILFEEPKEGASQNKITDDTLHGIFAVTAKIGDDDQAVATWIGKHPKESILLILDEATDMPHSILNALPNLNSHPDKFQLIAIGNSNSTMDLHGLLSTPKNGWDSVSPEISQWATTQLNGICLYYSPYESPAVHEEDPVKRKILEKFLMGRKNLEEKEKELGKDSEKFFRWVLGFWKSRNTEDVVTTQGFLKDFNPRIRVEWSGHYPLQRIAGLDPAFSTGGDKCMLRIANVGHATDNKVKIDFMQASLMFEIKLRAIVDTSVELQLADKAIEILRLHNVQLNMLAIDVTGQGRAIGEVIKLRNKELGFPLGDGNPLKIYAMSYHNTNKRTKSYPDIMPVSTHTLWNTIREYIEQAQVCGLDEETINQLTNRLVITDKNTKKQRLESKKEYKQRISAIGKGHSPDEADATALCLQVMRLRLGIEPGAMWPVPEKIVNRVQDKMYAQAVLNAPSANMVVTIPDADFSGGLDSYLQFKSPF